MNTDVLKAGQGRSVRVVGDLYTVLASGEDTAGAFALIHASVPAGSGPPPHRHSREDEAFYLMEGEIAFNADGKAFAATPGAWVTLARGSLHSFRNAGTSTARMLILVTPAGLEQYFLEAGQPVTDASAEPAPPDLGKLLALAPKYGLEIQLPSG